MCRQKSLEVLLDIVRQESDPQLPPWYIRVSTLAQHLNTTPSRDKLIAALRARGYVACLCHIEVSSYIYTTIATNVYECGQ